jgi:hypothetical protein
MTTRTTRLQALREALVLVVVCAAAVASFMLVQRRPAGPDELKIRIESLRSQFAELVLMNEQAGHAMPPRFLSAHARQLAQAVSDVRDELQDMDPQPELKAVREEGLAHAKRLLEAVEAVRRSGHALPPRSQAELQAQARSLQDREDRLRR